MSSIRLARSIPGQAAIVERTSMFGDTPKEMLFNNGFIFFKNEL